MIGDLTFRQPSVRHQQAVKRLLDGIERLSMLDGWVGAACLMLLIALMLAELTVRMLSNVFPGLPGGLPYTWEYCSYLMATCFTFGAAVTLRTGGHIRVNLLLTNVSAKSRKVLEIGVSLVGLLSVSFMTVAMSIFTWSSFASGQVSAGSGTPLWIPKLAVTLGILLLALQLLARLIQAVLGLPLEDSRLKPGAPRE
ncbi:putative TRAP-type C4-dicarboxylate transport system, small permease component [Pusillimonas sp. T7-7]|uniref:TRAP transporter small permease subunit n=1 Tax=Pusillimonas sp. (strain T7-7) TaxID=1007105 RepID=UPI00020850A9|nr:TRAP transporter small permease [Pusillimonas sp. T7-7]AEC21274.1 putative TRAP-type C4-dicarboxylate transport system, small permease component [Pusillimonas sp. T7-7]